MGLRSQLEKLEKFMDRPVTWPDRLENFLNPESPPPRRVWLVGGKWQDADMNIYDSAYDIEFLMEEIENGSFEGALLRGDHELTRFRRPSFLGNTLEDGTVVNRRRNPDLWVATVSGPGKEPVNEAFTKEDLVAALTMGELVIKDRYGRGLRDSEAEMLAALANDPLSGEKLAFIRAQPRGDRHLLMGIFTRAAKMGIEVDLHQAKILADSPQYYALDVRKDLMRGLVPEGLMATRRENEPEAPAFA